MVSQEPLSATTATLLESLRSLDCSSLRLVLMWRLLSSAKSPRKKWLTRLPVQRTLSLYIVNKTWPMKSRSFKLLLMKTLRTMSTWETSTARTLTLFSLLPRIIWCEALITDQLRGLTCTFAKPFLLRMIWIKLGKELVAKVTSAPGMHLKIFNLSALIKRWSLTKRSTSRLIEMVVAFWTSIRMLQPQLNERQLLKNVNEKR